jgi:LysR family transcriptional regulator, glycine cleavage system transcriptional activator
VFGRRRDVALTLRCAVSFAVNWLAPRLPDWLDHQPGRSIRILSSVWNDPADKGSFDLDIRYGTGDWPGCVSHRLTWETLAPLCVPGLRLATPDDLRHQRLLHVLGYQDGWGVWLNAAGARQVDAGRGLHLDTSLTAFAIAAQGGGVALGRSSLVAPELAAGRLLMPFDLAVPITEAFHLLLPEGGSRHPDAADFADWLLSKAEPQAS